MMQIVSVHLQFSQLHDLSELNTIFTRLCDDAVALLDLGLQRVSLFTFTLK